MPDGSRIAQCTTGRHSIIAETNTTYSKSRKSLQNSHFLVLCMFTPLSTVESWSIIRSTHAIKQRTVTFPRFYVGRCRGWKMDQKQGSCSSLSFNLLYHHHNIMLGIRPQAYKEIFLNFKELNKYYLVDSASPQFTELLLSLLNLDTVFSIQS